VSRPALENWLNFQPWELSNGPFCRRRVCDETRRAHRDIKRERGWSWKPITREIGGVSEVLIVGALLGQMRLVKPLARKVADLFGLSENEARMLSEIPNRGMAIAPTDPLIYRFHEMVMVNGPSQPPTPQIFAAV
jgi:cyanate lyase